MVKVLLNCILFFLLTVVHTGQSQHQFIIPAGAIRYVREVADSEPSGTTLQFQQQQQVTVPLPPAPPSPLDDITTTIREHKDAEILEIIKQGLERLRNAEKRLQKFVAKIEDGIKSGVLNKTIEQVKSKIETGKIDLHKFVSELKEKKSLTLQDLIKRISDDSYLLLDKLHSRHDSLGNRIKGGKSESSYEETAEIHVPSPPSPSLSLPTINSTPEQQGPRISPQ